MSDLPNDPNDPEGSGDPFEHLPDELRAMFEQMGGAGLFQQLQQTFASGGTGPVNWRLAEQVALQVAAEDDRSPTDAERARAAEALQIAEHWLDSSPLPSPPDAGRLEVTSRQGWVNAALTAMRPLVEPVARASTRALADLAEEQMTELPMDQLGLGQLLGQMGNLSDMLRPVGAMLTGMQTGQIIGQLARQLIGQYELGIPTAPRAAAYHLAVNVEDVFGEWELDATEVDLVLLLGEAAHRRLYHAVPWLEAHVHGLVAQFANGTEVDAERLQQLGQELMLGVDPNDPESLQHAMERAADFRLEPTPAQRRVLERLQGVISLVQAWARHEVRRAAGDRLPNLARIEEVLRRRRAERGHGEVLLAQLLGLDLKHDDETLGEIFVSTVEDARGPEGLRRALAHPENLPDAEELADPSRWLARMAGGEEIPDDASGLFEGLGEAPVEKSAEERRAEHQRGEGRPGDDDDDGDDDAGAAGGGGG